jgi:hypothetical protein
MRWSLLMSRGIETLQGAEVLTMSQTVGDFLVQRLHQWGVRHIFGYPVVLEVKTDTGVPPLPPHIMLQQAKNFSIALAKGDPDEVGVIRGAARQMLETILPDRA